MPGHFHPPSLEWSTFPTAPTWIPDLFHDGDADDNRRGRTGVTAVPGHFHPLLCEHPRCQVCACPSPEPPSRLRHAIIHYLVIHRLAPVMTIPCNQELYLIMGLVSWKESLNERRRHARLVDRRCCIDPHYSFDSDPDIVAAPKARKGTAANYTLSGVFLL